MLKCKVYIITVEKSSVKKNKVMEYTEFINGGQPGSS